MKIVELGSLSKAARQLYVAQPALSQQISKLEQEVGQLLLLRSSRGVTPTVNGKALYHHANLILRQFEQAMSIVKAHVPSISGMVSIGLPATTVAAIGLPLVRRLHDHYPGILINVVEAMSGHIEQLIEQNQLDLAVLFTGARVASLDVEPLMSEELFLILSEDSQLFPPEQTTVTLSEAADIPLILPTSHHGLRRRVSFEFENVGFSMNVVAEIDSLSLVLSCVQAGIGATIKPFGAVMQESHKGRKYRCLSFSDVEMRRSNFLYSLPQPNLTPAAEVVALELKNTIAGLIADTRWPGFYSVSPDNFACPVKK